MSFLSGQIHAGGPAFARTSPDPDTMVMTTGDVGRRLVPQSETRDRQTDG